MPREPTAVAAGPLAGVVELDLLRSPQIPAALAEELPHLVHAPRLGQARADGAVEGILADPDEVTLAAALEVDRSHQIDLVQLVAVAGLRAGVLLTWQQGSQADAWPGQAVSLQ